VLSEVLWKTELSLLTLFGLVAVIGWQHDSSGVLAPEVLSGIVRESKSVGCDFYMSVTSRGTVIRPF